MNFEKTLLQQRSKILSDAASDTTRKTFDFLNLDFPMKDQFFACLPFIDQCIIQSFPSTFEMVGKFGYFPGTEAEYELQQAINLSFLAQYKSSFDSIRRATELVIVSVYFLDDSLPLSEAQNWVKSKDSTPMFSHMLKKIGKRKNFLVFEKEFKCIESIKNFYWELSDICHTRGIPFSLTKIQDTRNIVNGVSVPNFSPEAFQFFASKFISAIQHIAVFLTLMNPIILTPLPMFEKFGLNPPMSGFFEFPEVETLKAVLPNDFFAFAEDYFQNDSEIVSIIEDISNRSDLTEEQLNLQIKNQDALMNRGT